MHIKIEDQNTTRKLVTVSMEAEKVKTAEKEVLKDFMKIASLPGFRKGKVPEAVVRNKYKKDIENELRSYVIGKAYDAARDESGLQFYSVVGAEPVGDITYGHPAIIKFTVDVLADFSLPEYKSIKVALEEVAVTNEDIDAELTKILEERAKYEIVSQHASTGNYVKLDYEGKIDGVLITEIVPQKAVYGTQLNTWEEAGTGKEAGVPCVAEGILGMKTGDEKTVECDFPQDFEVTELAGKHAVYGIKVHEVREKQIPELDHNLLNELGVNTKEQLTQSIEKKLKDSRAYESKMQAKNQLAEQLAESVQFDLPQSAIDEATDNILKKQMSMMIRFGMKEDAFLTHKDSMIKAATHSAQKTAKLAIIAKKIALQEKIELTNDDLSRKVMEDAMMSGMKPEQFVNELKKDKKKIEDLREGALVAKVLDFLLRNSSVESKQASSTEDA